MTVGVRNAWIATVALLLTSKAHAATTCSVEVVTALRVPRVSISVAAPVPAKDGQPSHCLTEGSVVTTGQGAPDGRAGFQLRPSETWQQRFFFMGVDGNAGNFTPAVNQVD